MSTQAHFRNASKEYQLSPVKCLPPEVLSEIFVHCLDTQSQFIKPHHTQAPLLLTEVCKYWNECALGTPRLWCSLEINEFLVWESDFDESDSALFLETMLKFARLLSRPTIVDTWFTRAKTQPLSLSIYLDGEICEGTRACMEALRYWIPHCRVLRLHLNPSWLSVLSGLKCPVLWDCEVAYDAEQEPIGLEAPCHAPCLQKLTLCGDTDWALQGLVFLPSRLMGLEWGSGNPSGLEVMLQRCDSLTELSLIFPNMFMNHELTTLPNVQALIVAVDEEDCLDPCLRSFRLPKLQKLELNVNKGCGVGEVGGPSIRALLSNSNCRLTHLHIWLCGPFFQNRIDFQRLVRDVPDLEILHMEGYENEISVYPLEDLIACLEYNDTRSTDQLLLKLTNLTIICQPKHHRFPSTRSVETMIRSRTKPVEHMEVTAIDEPESPSGECVEIVSRSPTTSPARDGFQKAYLQFIKVEMTSLWGPGMSVKWYGLASGKIFREVKIDHFDTHCITEVTL